MERKSKSRDFRIRAWSAGCSSGEEPYSIAITLLDAVEGKGRWDIKVLATDISTSMLEVAQMGVYDKQRVNPVSPLQRQKYLIHSQRNKHSVFEVSKNLKDVVVFRYLNLMQEWPINPPGGVDFIFCRNVMIYFDKQTQENLVNRYWNVLAPRGIVFTGHSESLTGIRHKYKYIQPTIYAKS
jgi:chemotaxis protein methyltransferase CheR